MSVTKEEFDTSPIAWETYKLMYAENFEKNEIIDSFNRKYKHTIFTYNGKSTGRMKFSGETDFNFDFGRSFAHAGSEKYRKYIEKVEISKEDKDKYLHNLNICGKLYKKIVNISIMPQTGNLQGVKKGIGNDRLDTFIHKLDDYYNKRSNLMTNYVSYENMDNLKEYLGIFGNVKNYCGAIYHIDGVLVNDLINSGKEAIDSVERVISYMNLAQRFWSQKLDYLKKQKNLSEEMNRAINEAETVLGGFEFDES